jgi:sigma-B regulation protein RsbU (phosphoserine phosphatase)
VWSEPYYDEGGGDSIMTTYSVPLFRSSGTGESIGVVTADVTLERLQAYLGRIRLGMTGYAALLSREGRVLSHPDTSKLMQPVASTNPRLTNDAAWQEALARALRGETGLARLQCPQTEGACLYAWSPLGDTGWPITVIYPEHEMLSDLRKHSFKVLWISALGILLLVLAVVVVSRTVTQPLVALAAASDRLGGGDLGITLPPARSHDEVGLLIGAFRKMQARLKDFIARLEQETATRNRLQGEMDAAHQIQMEMLPQQGKAFLRGARYSLWARLEPAKAVGGDLYTWLDVDKDLLMIVVGDVSDKGVPAALFMSRTITLLQQYAVAAPSPGAILVRLNQSLVQHNDTCMFATLFCGVLNTQTGVLSFASGGHTPPMLVRDGQAAPVEQEHGPALGISDDASYPSNQIQLRTGDLLAVYTDGVDEAFNAQEEMFGHERLANTLVRVGSNDVRRAGESVLDALNAFVAGTPQSDDITVVLIGWEARSAVLADMRTVATSTREIAARVQNLEVLFEWLEDWLTKQNLASAELVHDLRLVGEEIFLNIVQYSGLSAQESVRVVLAHDEAMVALEFIDRGKPWNPLEEAPEVALGQSTEDAAVGGLGVLLVHELTDERIYRRDDGANRLCVLGSCRAPTQAGKHESPHDFC